VESRNQAAQIQKCTPAGILKDVRYPSSKSMEKGCCLFAALRKHQRKAEDCGYEEDAKLAVLTAAKESVELPVIFGPWHDCEQESGEQEQSSTAQGVGSSESLDGCAAGDESLLQ
jgi:hypothetical protein